MQLTFGQRVAGLESPAFNETERRFGLFGTDLGASFAHDGRLWFLFGDTWPSPSGPDADVGDSVAFTTDTDPEAGVRLEFVADGGVTAAHSLSSFG